MRIGWAEEQLDGEMLYNLLSRHKLLPDSLKDPNICMAYAQILNIGFLHDEGPKPLAVLLEMSPEPGVVGISFITEVARLHQRKAELIEVSHVLRDRWFNGFGAYRVECRVPVDRTQSLRCLRHLGFRLETLPKGLRNATLHHGKPVSLCVLSLLPSDPVRSLPLDPEDHIIHEDRVFDSKEEEVASGLL